MVALNLIFALPAAGAVAAVMALGFFVDPNRAERRSATVAELASDREPDLEAA